MLFCRVRATGASVSYASVALTNPYLIARYDGSVIDAMPWGRGSRGTDGCPPGPAPGMEAFGVWPGPPLSGGGDPPAAPDGTTGEARKTWLEEALEPTLSERALGSAAADAQSVERRNPLALAHFANHPPAGVTPNVVVASVDVVFPALARAHEGGKEGEDEDEDAEDIRAKRDLRRFLPNVGLGEWDAPLTPLEAEAAVEGVETKKTAAGFQGWLEELFGTTDDGPKGTGAIGANAKGEGAAGRARERRELVVPTLVLVATHALQDEEVFLNYRLSTHVKRPDWYHPVNPEEDERRWAVNAED